MNPPSDFRPGLSPPQFSLRTLLLSVTLCAVFFALVNLLPPMTIAGLAFLIAILFAHIAGNAIGSRLKENGNQPIDINGHPQSRDVSSTQLVPANAPPTQLGKRQGLGWPVLAATAAGLVAGGAFGGAWTALSAGHHVAAFNIAVGITAFGVLGGIAAFLGFSFVQVGVGAFRQALRNSRCSADEAGG